MLSVCNHPSNHLDNISGIRTRVVEIVSVFEMGFRSEKDIWATFSWKFCWVLAGLGIFWPGR
jgi:hypothetical protein